MENWPILTDQDLERCAAIVRRRAELGRDPAGQALRIHIASMGDNAGRQLTRLIKHLQVSKIFEIGTCAGIGAAYMCSAAELRGPVIYHGMEGVEAKRQIALATLAELCPNTDVTIHAGHFDDSFEVALAAAASLEFVYLDGRHKRDPSLHMFQRCLECMPNGGTLVADDLSMAAMGDCRKQFRTHPRVQSYTTFAKKEAYAIGAM